MAKKVGGVKPDSTQQIRTMLDNKTSLQFSTAFSCTLIYQEREAEILSAQTE